MTAREVLLKAAEHIERYGWLQGARGKTGQPCCAVGAINAVGGCDRSSRDDAIETLKRNIGLARPFAIQNWNDAPGRTKEDVIAALRGAANAAA